MRSSVRPVVVLLATLAVFGAAGALSASGSGNGDALKVAHYFTVSCGFSHAAPDDPIVFPRDPGFSHEHSFIGNVSTNAFSTPASIRRHGSTCDRLGDASAYWVPTLYDNDRPVEPDQVTIVYRRLTVAPVRPFGTGLVMVAGNSHAIEPQSASVTSWRCAQVKLNFYAPLARPMDPASNESANGFAECDSPSNLELVVNFPNCTNGSLDSANHKSHMAYSVAGRCPASHPIPVPAITIVVRYPTVSGDVILSSGGVNSGHADFMNGWNQFALKQLVDDCLNARAVCGYPSEPEALR